MSFSLSLSPRMLHIVKLSVLVFCLLFTAYYTLTPSPSTGYKSFYNVAISGKKGAFLSTASITEIDGPFDNSTLVELCRRRTWTPGLIFKCEAPAGGIANVRNIILNCVRYAIEAGATGFIIPEILARGTTPATPHTNLPVPLNHFFDLDFFTRSLNTSCPQIKLYSHQNDLWDKPSTAKPILLEPSTLTPLLYDSILARPQNWSSAFHTHLSTTYTRPLSVSLPALVTLRDPLLQFPLSYDDPKFVSNFGKILPFTPTIRRLSSTILYALSQKQNLHLSPTSKIEKGKYYGAHLRTAFDAQAAGWTSYSVQSANYLSAAQSLNLSTIYLVSGNPVDIIQFTILAHNHSIKVETSSTLLGGPLPTPFQDRDAEGREVLVQGERKGAPGMEREWMEYSALTEEQRGCVDYEVLLRATGFGGTWESSFSWGVAMRRHVVVSGGGWKGFSAPPETASPPPTQLSRKRFDGGGEWEGEHFSAEKLGRTVKRGVRPGVKEAATENAERIKNGEAQADGDKNGKLGEHSFQDALSTIFGPRGEGKVFELSLWP